MRFSQELPSGMCKCAIGWVVPDISKNYNAFMSSKQSRKTVWLSEDEGTMIIGAVGTYPSNNSVTSQKI